MTFDLQAARAICDKLASGKDAIDIDYQNALAAEMLEKLLDALDFQPGDGLHIKLALAAIEFSRGAFTSSGRLTDGDIDTAIDCLRRYQVMAAKTEERK